MQRQLGIWKRFIISLSGVDICSLSRESGRGLLEVYQWWTDADSAGDLEEVDQKFISSWTESAKAADLEEAYYNFISGGQMQPQLGIWKRFISSLVVVDRCSLSWGCGRGLLEVYQGWTDASSAGDLEEVYQKFIVGGQMQPYLGIQKRFIRSLLAVNTCSLSWGSGRGLLEIYQLRTDAASDGDLEEVYQMFIIG